MSALDQPRDTPRLATEPIVASVQYPVKADVIIYAGALVALDADGFLVPAAATAALKVVGRAEETFDANVADYTDGDKLLLVRQGTFKWGNSASGQEIVRAAVGEPCYVVDDQTVSRYSLGGTRPPAGIVIDIEDDGVWVESRIALSQILRLAGEIDVLS